jgi:hypothetical protein
VQTDKNTGSTKCAIDELVNVCVLFVHVHSNLNGLQSLIELKCQTFEFISSRLGLFRLHFQEITHL